MRVLWFTHVPAKDLVEHWGQRATGTGFWIHSLVEPLRQSQAISRLGVVYAGANCPTEHVSIAGVDYYSVRQSWLTAVYGLGRRRDERRCLRVFLDIIERFRPDLIHIHGTERFYGQLKAQRMTDVPTVVSVQGLMGPCAQHAWGGKTFWNMLCLVNAWEVKRMFPTLTLRRRYRQAARREVQILAAVDGILGRTHWDRSYCRAVAPQTRYFHVDEMMRPEFFGPQWSLQNTQRHRVYTSGRMTFSKGMHVFLEAMGLLKRDYPGLEVRIAGSTVPSSEDRYLKTQVRELGLAEAVTFLDWIPGRRIVEELLSARCYANASFIENGCNALQEAMLLGCPCVTTFTGGMATTLAHRQTGLMAPRDDAPLLADGIRELFEDDALCVRLGAAAREVAYRRHDPPAVLAQLLSAYRATLEHASPPKAPWGND